MFFLHWVGSQICAGVLLTGWHKDSWAFSFCLPQRIRLNTPSDGIWYPSQSLLLKGSMLPSANLARVRKASVTVVLWIFLEDQSKSPTRSRRKEPPLPVTPLTSVHPIAPIACASFSPSSGVTTLDLCRSLFAPTASSINESFPFNHHKQDREIEFESLNAPSKKGRGLSMAPEDRSSTIHRLVTLSNDARSVIS